MSDQDSPVIFIDDNGVIALTFLLSLIHYDDLARSIAKFVPQDLLPVDVEGAS